MGIEPTSSAWKAEVLPLNYTRGSARRAGAAVWHPGRAHRIPGFFRRPSTGAVNLVEGGGFEPPKAEPSDLQSDPFDRSGTPPERKTRSMSLARSAVNAPDARGAGTELAPRQARHASVDPSVPPGRAALSICAQRCAPPRRPQPAAYRPIVTPCRARARPRRWAGPFAERWWPASPRNRSDPVARHQVVLDETRLRAPRRRAPGVAPAGFGRHRHQD